MEGLANTHIPLSFAWAARSILSFMLQRKKLCWERVRLLQEVSGRGLNKAQFPGVRVSHLNAHCVSARDGKVVVQVLQDT